MTTTHAVNEDGDELELTEYARTAIRQAFTYYDGVGLDESGSGSLSVIRCWDWIDEYHQRVASFEVLVDVVGRLDLETVTEEQGRLLYCKDGVDVMLKGFEDGMVLIEVEQVLGDGPHPIFGCDKLTVTTDRYGEIELEVHTSSPIQSDEKTKAWNAEVDCLTDDDVPPLLLTVEQHTDDSEPVVSLKKPKGSDGHLWTEDIDVTDYEVVE